MWYMRPTNTCMFKSALLISIFPSSRCEQQYVSKASNKHMNRQKLRQDSNQVRFEGLNQRQLQAGKGGRGEGVGSV